MKLYKVDRWDVAIVWFRRDLRLADHPALTYQIQVVPAGVSLDEGPVVIDPAPRRPG